ncbi:hypothetical protein FPOAC2_09820 [Fusarium poae]
MPEPKDASDSNIVDRKHMTAQDVVHDVWIGLDLPEAALASLKLPGDEGPALPSSSKIGILAQASIALSALAAAQIHARRNQSPVPQVTVPLEHAVIEYKSERLYTIDGQPTPARGTIGGLHKTSDGYVRIHDSFPNHVHGTLKLLRLPLDANRQQVSERTAKWAAIDLENLGPASTV